MTPALALGRALGPVAVGRLADRGVALQPGAQGAGDSGQRAGHPGDPQIGGEIGAVADALGEDVAIDCEPGTGEAEDEQCAI